MTDGGRQKQLARMVDLVLCRRTTCKPVKRIVFGIALAIFFLAILLLLYIRFGTARGVGVGMSGDTCP